MIYSKYINFIGLARMGIREIAGLRGRRGHLWNSGKKPEHPNSESTRCDHKDLHCKLAISNSNFSMLPYYSREP